MTYTSPEFLDAQARYRRQRLAGERQARHAAKAATPFLPHRAWATVSVLSGLRLPARRRRHA